MLSFGKRLLNQLPDLSLPEMTREVEIAVYLVHNSTDPEDYFFLFDFEEFVEKSKAGLFVRPVIRIFAGRDDFSRTIFAREFREVFSREFDRMRAELAAKKNRFGWLSFGTAFDLLSGFVSSIVLSIALSAGNKILERIGVGALLKGKSDGAKLRDEIEKTKSQVETALQRIEITIHRELYDYAYRDGFMGKISGMDREAWPLPHYVRSHLDKGESSSWW
ncbi:hypothetical protein NBRC116590_04890 [Pelagimonas sp. KU-00592-HH]|uniref:hypothetical protein n=1 Tax=Pelagimonas sp. KU-00592-HH TaxID=3127651 RepID=UPI003102245B